MKSPTQLKIQLSPLVENMAVSKTIEIHSLTKDMEKAGMEITAIIDLI